MAAVAHLRASDHHLAELMDRVGPFVLPMNTALTTFGMLVEALVYQQLSGKAAATIFGRVCALFGPDVQRPVPKQILAVIDLAVKVDQGLIPSLTELREMDDEQVISCLTWHLWQALELAQDERR